MARKNGLKTIGKILAWIVGLVIVLVIANAMIAGILVLPTFLGGATVAGLLVAKVAGWIILVMAIIGAVLSIIK